MTYLLIALGLYLIGFGFLVRFVQVVRQRDGFMHDAHDRWLGENRSSPSVKEAS
jgi:hypothetical protein